MKKTKKSLILWGLTVSLLYNGSLVSAAASDVQADEGLDVYDLGEITVVADRPEWEEILSPGSVTVIEPKNLEGEQKTLPEVLKDVPGVHVREVNGKGQYTTVSVRGSTAAQVGVFVDGILTNLGGDAAVDISAIPIDNVERIEVYRGYIPARFGGTYIGGVINIITKKPTKASVSVELGKSSYGGDKASLELTSPLGSGSLMVGASYEDSNGRFLYENYSNDKAVTDVSREIGSQNNVIVNFNPDNVDTYGDKAGLSATQQDSYKADQAAWVSYVQGGSFASDLSSNATTVFSSASFQDIPGIADYVQSYKSAYLSAGYTESNWLEGAKEDWNGVFGSPGVIDATAKSAVVGNIVSDYNANTVPGIVRDADPAQSERLSRYRTALANLEKKKAKLASSDRYRKYNDFKKSNVILKWQDKNWTIKGSYNKLDRHLPDSLWGGDVMNIAGKALVDVDDIYYYESRRQIVENKEILLQHRQEIGKLEWGWTANYLNSNKNYRAEKFSLMGERDALDVPLRAWSDYRSNRYGLQIDGSYKLTDNQMLDFQTNYSNEKLKIKGSLMDEVLGDTIIGNSLGSMRDEYKQEIFNIQVQDTITLDKNSTWFLSPSIKYNQSTITGYCNGKRFSAVTKTKFPWLNEQDTQKDGKTTWQLALKKVFDDHWTIRTTGGTYYRLLNMFEIAGDGAGILPRPYSGGTVFPTPEQGKQFDFSVMWKGDMLGAKSNATVTYFWRDTDDMLQLERYGKDYSCYFNDRKGKANGVEAQWLLKWKKFGLELKGTYTNSQVEGKETATSTDYSEMWATYQPKWEGTARFTYTPTEKWTIFSELQYTGEYFTSSSKGPAGGDPYLYGRPVSPLTRINLGLKWKPVKDWQIALGCNDIFNRGPQQRVSSSSGSYNVEYPLQGRTFYATVKYTF